MRQPEKRPSRNPDPQTRLAAGLLALLLAAPLPALADARQEVTRLMQEGQTAKALQQADKHLGSNAQDTEMRLLKGVLLAETGKTAEAIQAFKALAAEHPQLPEPHNNLAVLYARQRQFDQARQALEMAIRTHPSYATVLANLGDINTQLASQSYAKALQLDTRQTPTPRLSMIVGFAGTDAGGKDEARSTVQPVVQAPAPSAAPTVPAAPAVSPAASTTTEPVLSAVKAWARAWASKDIGSYLASYSKDFVPTPTVPRTSWENDRKQRILNKSRIEISITEAKVKLEGNSAIVSFQQHYQADGMTLRNRKTLNMVRDGGRWLIAREITGT